MRKAYHPTSNEFLSVEEYISKYGNKPLFGDDFRPKTRCPFCMQKLYIKAASTPDSEGHFAHFPKSGYCPSKESSKLPYLNKFPTRPDIHNANRVKNLFLINWEKHYKQISNIIKNLSPSEFIQLVKIANSQRIWEYSNLEEFHLPYIFVTFADFKPQFFSNPKSQNYVRKNWFRCWFDASVNCYEDIWIERNTPLLLWVAWFQPPIGKKRTPDYDDIKGAYSLDISDEFLSVDPNFSTKLIDKVEPELNKLIIVN